MIKTILWGIIIGLVAIIVINTAIFYVINAQSHYAIVTKTINEEGDNYSISVSYPRIDYLKAYQDKFNNLVESGIQQQIKDFKNTVSQPVNPLIPKTIKNSLVIRYSLIGNSSNYISLVFNKEEFYAGYAHPTHTLSSLNYEFKTGNNVALQDLFKPGSDYLDTISNYSYRLFLKQIQSTQLGSTREYLDQEKGTAPEIKNFEIYGITDQALILYFQEYQVGPYVAGQPKVTIPYIALANIVNPDGLLWQYVKNIPKSALPSGDTTHADWKTYQDNSVGFEIKYPADITPTSTFKMYYHLSNRWSSADYSENPKGVPLVSFPVYSVQNDNSYPRYYAVEVRLGESSDQNDVKNCFDNSKTNLGIEQEDVSIGGVQFKKYQIQNAGMMQYLKGFAYRAIINGECFAMEQIATGSSYRDDPPSSKDISDAVLNSYFDKAGDIVKTFQLLK